jgi:hypothetical protein
MRTRRDITIPAGATWPQCEAMTPTMPESGYSWLHIENRSAVGNDIVWGVAAIDDATYYGSVAAGFEVTLNIAGPKDEPGRQLFIKNLGAAAATLSVTMSDSPIVCIRNPIPIH